MYIKIILYIEIKYIERINMSKKKRFYRPRSESKVRILPLGGLSEIGKNMTVVECDEDIIIIDCGLGFPDDDMLGIDLVIPDITYLSDKVDRIRGIFLTHGHEDHIGALPYILKELPVPVYGTKLTLGVLAGKLIRKTHDPAHVGDDKAKWDVVPTKISMDEILSVDLTPQDFSTQEKEGEN